MILPTIAGPVSALKEQFSSALYLCVDDAPEKDQALEGGLKAIFDGFNGAALHIPFDLDDHKSRGPLYPLTAIGNYAKYADALDRLQKPTVVICKSTKR